MSEARTDTVGPISSEIVKTDPSFAELVTQFVEGLGERLANMDGAIRAADFERLRVAAHQLKGSGGGYGYSILTELAGGLEKHAKSMSMTDCISSFDVLREVCSRIVVTD